MNNKLPSDLTELLIECIDALTLPQHDGGDRHTHLHKIAQALSERELPNGTRTLLEKTASLFETHLGMDAMHFAVSDKSHLNELAAEIEQAIDGPLFVYHGTILGRLKSIAKDGLKAGEQSVWKEEQVSREYLESAVFFETTWRKALDWALITHVKSRGPKEGRNRQPIVIRVPRQGLIIESDDIAFSRNAIKTNGVVHIQNAKVLVGKTEGYPEWLSLDAAL